MRPSRSINFSRKPAFIQPRMNTNEHECKVPGSKPQHPLNRQTPMFTVPAWHGCGTFGIWIIGVSLELGPWVLELASPALPLSTFPRVDNSIRRAQESAREFP